MRGQAKANRSPSEDAAQTAIVDYNLGVSMSCRGDSKSYNREGGLSVHSPPEYFPCFIVCPSYMVVQMQAGVR